jgi:hypothetical protein
VRNFNKFVVYFAGFSLMNWFTTTGYSDSSPLTGDALDDLEEILFFPLKNQPRCKYTIIPAVTADI